MVAVLLISVDGKRRLDTPWAGYSMRFFLLLLLLIVVIYHHCARTAAAFPYTTNAATRLFLLGTGFALGSTGTTRLARLIRRGGSTRRHQQTSQQDQSQTSPPLPIQRLPEQRPTEQGLCRGRGGGADVTFELRGGGGKGVVRDIDSDGQRYRG